MSRTKLAGIITALAFVPSAGLLALAGPASAQHGADDGPGHVRHGHHAHHHAHHHAKGHHRHGHGNDDGPGHHRHGNDDGPNHH